MKIIIKNTCVIELSSISLQYQIKIENKHYDNYNQQRPLLRKN